MWGLSGLTGGGGPSALRWMAAKAEFPCGLMGRGWAEALRCRLGVCRIVVEFLDGFCVIFSLVYGMVGISYKIFCLYGHSWSFGF